MVVSTAALVRLFLEVNGPSPLGIIADGTVLPVTSVRDHVETNSLRDDDGNFCDTYGFFYKDIDGHGTRHWYLTGKEQQ